MVKDITRWKWPVRNADAELKSLRLQSDRYYTGKAPVQSELRSVTEKMLKMYPAADRPWAFYYGDFNPAGFELSYNTALAGIEKDSSPGMPFAAMQCASNADVVNTYPQMLKDLVRARLLLLAYASELSNDPVELVTGGFCDPVRIFIKNEPHNPDKIREGRLRLISSVSLVDQMCERVLYGKQNAAEIAMWDAIPSKPGMGLNDDQLGLLYGAWTAMKHPHEADISGWDFSMQDWEMKWEVDFRAELSRSLHTPYHNAMRNRVHCEARTLFMLSDGRLYAQRVAGKRCSGSYNTSAGNSRCRVMIGLLIGSKSIFAMGDDSVEDNDMDAKKVVSLYSEYGHRVKMYEPCQDGFEFCSTRIKKRDGKIIGEPQNWSRSTFRLLYATQDLEARMDQFKYEMRGMENYDTFIPVVEKLLALNRAPTREMDGDAMVVETQDGTARETGRIDQSGAVNRVTCKIESGRGVPQMPQKKKSKAKARKAKGKSSKPAGPPVAVSFKEKKKKSKISSSRSNGGLVVSLRHREYLEDVFTNGSGNLDTFAYYINAAWVDSFPWLGVIGANFQKYVFKNLTWEYTPACSTQTAGNVLMATNPDVHDPLFSSYEQFMGAQGSVQSNAWQAFQHKSTNIVDCRRKGLCRATEPPSNADQNLYDAGIFQMQVYGAPPNTRLGRLSVSYDVELHIPVVSTVNDVYQVLGEQSFVTGFDHWGKRVLAITNNPETVKLGPDTMGVVSGDDSSIMFLRPGTYYLTVEANDLTGSTVTGNTINQYWYSEPVLSNLGPPGAPVSFITDYLEAGNGSGQPFGETSLVRTFIIVIGVARVIMTWMSGFLGAQATNWKFSINSWPLAAFGPLLLNPAVKVSLSTQDAEQVAKSAFRDPTLQRVLVRKLTAPKEQKAEAKAA